MNKTVCSIVCSKRNTGANEHGKREGIAWEGIRNIRATHSIRLSHPSHMRYSEGGTSLFTTMYKILY